MNLRAACKRAAKNFLRVRPFVEQYLAVIREAIVTLHKVRSEKRVIALEIYYHSVATEPALDLFQFAAQHFRRVVYQAYVVAHLFDLLHLVRRKDYGLAARFQIEYYAFQNIDADGVEAGKRFV